MALMMRAPESAPSSLPMPLSAPDVDVAMAFLQEIVPPTVFSAGSGRRRRKGPVAAAEGHRSDTAFLVFYRSAGGPAPQLTPLKSPVSIRDYLEQQASAAPADVWVCTQTTQYRARRDGKILTMGLTTDQARHILNVVVDLDGSRMDPVYRELLRSHPSLLLDLVEDQLREIGVDKFLVVQSSPGGLHVYLPVLRPDGRPLRAAERTMAVWERVARGASRLLAPFGADSNAVKPTQPFIIPGLVPAKHPGFIPFVARRGAGMANDLYALLRRLSERKLIPARERVMPTTDRNEAPSDATAIIAAVRDQAEGVAQGNRNQVAHDLAVFLMAKGATAAQAKGAMEAWNRRNTPPLSGRELSGCLRSAERCADRYPAKWEAMQKAPWNRLRAIVGLPAETSRGYLKAGRWRPLTPAKPWEARKQGGGREHFEEVAERLLRFVAGEGGGRLEMTQAEIIDAIDTNPSTLKAVLRLLVASGRLLVTGKRGRGGKTVLVVPQAAETAAPLLTVNGQCGYSTVGVQMGAWVGAGVSGSLASGDRVGREGEEAVGSALAVVFAVIEEAVGVDLRGVEPVPLVLVAGRCWRLVARTGAGRLVLARLSAHRWWLAELECRLGGPVMVAGFGDRGRAEVVPGLGIARWRT